MSIAESIPCLITEDRSAYYTLHRGHLAIISCRTYNMDNYFTKICISPRKYFICLIYFVAYTWIIPFLCATFIFTSNQKVFNQKIQGLYIKYYIYNKQTIENNNIVN